MGPSEKVKSNDQESGIEKYFKKSLQLKPKKMLLLLETSNLGSFGEGANFKRSGRVYL